MKKILLFTITALLVLAFFYFGYQSYQKIQAQKVFASRVQRLPNPNLFTWVNQKPKPSQMATIVLFFSPDCEHCQYEAEAIFKQKEQFANTNLWWVSTADGLVIKTFTQKYGLENLPNMYFAHLSNQKVYQTFGSIAIPHIFIYDRQQNLQKEFKGETKIEALLKYCP